MVILPWFPEACPRQARRPVTWGMGTHAGKGESRFERLDIRISNNSGLTLYRGKHSTGDAGVRFTDWPCGFVFMVGGGDEMCHWQNGELRSPALPRVSARQAGGLRHASRLAQDREQFRPLHLQKPRV